MHAFTAYIHSFNISPFQCQLIRALKSLTRAINHQFVLKERLLALTFVKVTREIERDIERDRERAIQTETQRERHTERVSFTPLKMIDFVDRY